MVTNDSAQQALKTITTATRVIVLCHSNPDGDAIGSLLSIGLLVERHLQKQVVFCCKDPLPQTFSYLPTGRVQPLVELQTGDCIIFTDCAEPKQTGYQESHPQLFDGSLPTINIDHHHGNPLFASVNIVEPAASSACEVIADLSTALQWNLDPETATTLMTGIYTDTGGLLHSNTTPRVYRWMGILLRAGARQQDIVQSVFRSSKLSTLRLWGRVLEKVSLTPEGGAVSAVTREDFAATGSDHTEMTGAIDYVNAIPNIKFSLILSERGDKVKGSLRTLRDDVDVSAMAGKFGGGGHKKAAGFALDGRLEPEVRWKVVGG